MDSLKINFIDGTHVYISCNDTIAFMRSININNMPSLHKEAFSMSDSDNMLDIVVNFLCAGGYFLISHSAKMVYNTSTVVSVEYA